MPHLHSHLSVQSTRALMCVGEWSLRGYVKNSDVNEVVVLLDIEGNEEELDDSWDKIN